MIWYILAFIIAGVASGYLAGLFGIGGGILRIPIFVALFSHFGVAHDVVMHVSAGTSLALVIPSAITASIRQHRMGKLDLGYYKTWAIGIAIGVILGLFLLPWLSTVDLQVIFIVFLVIVAIYIGFVHEDFVIRKKIPTGWLKGIISTVIGFSALILGIGGGAVTTPTMKAFGYPIKKAIALSTATGFVVGSIGAIGAIIEGIGAPGRPPYALGYVDLVAFCLMLPIVMVLAPLGARTANHMHHRTLRRTYGIFLLLSAGWMSWNLIVSNGA